MPALNYIVFGKGSSSFCFYVLILFVLSLACTLGALWEVSAKTLQELLPEQRIACSLEDGFMPL